MSPPLTIGVSDGGYGDFHFRGLIDEVKIFNRALTAAEIAAIYTAGGADPCGTTPDTTPPVIAGLPTNLLLEATGPAGAVATWMAPTATDDTDESVPVTCTPASGSAFPLGVTTPVTCTATDAAGNPATGSFTVKVIDTTPPTITNLTRNLATLWPPNHKMVNVTVTARTSDAVSGTASVCRITGATSSEADNDLGSFVTAAVPHGGFDGEAASTGRLP